MTSVKIALGFVVAVVVAGLPASSLSAATITWGLATGISGDADVSTDGTLVYAYNLAETTVNVTVNGVAFAGFSAPTNGSSATHGDVTLVGGTFFSTDTAWGSASAPFANLSADYQNLLRSGTQRGYANEAFTLTMTGLTSGRTYQFQWWSSLSGYNGFTLQTTATAGQSVTLFSDPSLSSGGAGQFATGQFTADSSSQSIVITGGGNGQLLTAFQLRQVPEPASLALLVLGGLAIARRR